MFDGEGAFLFDGRWNSRGTRLVYTASSLSLATALEVPTSVVPRERNYLLNPAHPDFREIVLSAPEPFPFNERLVRTASRKKK